MLKRIHVYIVHTCIALLMEREETVCLCGTAARRHVAVLSEGKYSKVYGPLRAYEYLECKELGIIKCVFLVDVDGFYRCNSCKGMIRAVCNVCHTNDVYANNYNVLTQRVICTSCLTDKRPERIWGRPSNFFALPPPVCTKVTRNGSVRKCIPKMVQTTSSIVTYCSMSITIISYVNGCPRRCVYCCNTYTDAVRDAEVLKYHKLERSICYKCVVDFFMDQGAFSLIPRVVTCGSEAFLGLDDDIL